MTLSRFQTQVGSDLSGGSLNPASVSTKSRPDDRYFAVDSGGQVEPKRSRVFTCSVGGELTIQEHDSALSDDESSHHETDPTYSIDS